MEESITRFHHKTSDHHSAEDIEFHHETSEPPQPDTLSFTLSFPPMESPVLFHLLSLHYNAFSVLSFCFRTDGGIILLFAYNIHTTKIGGGGVFI
jgi:hypothetical protein